MDKLFLIMKIEEILSKYIVGTTKKYECKMELIELFKRVVKEAFKDLF